jgi:hypothetical protein
MGHRWFVQDHHANGAKNEATTNRISFSRFSHVPLPPPGTKRYAFFVFHAAPRNILALPEDNLPDRPAAIPKVDPEKLKQGVSKHVDHWIGLKENSNRKTQYFMGKSWENRWFPVRIFPRKPIQ